MAVVVQVLIAQRHPEYPLTDQRFHLVFNQTRSAVVHKAPGKTVHQTERLVRDPGNSAPASDVPRPALNETSTRRPETGAKPNKSMIHSVGIGGFFTVLGQLFVNKSIYPDSEPRCA